MKKTIAVALLIAGVLAGCASTPNPKCVQSPIQHTGPVTVVDISIGYCQWKEKSGTAVCDRTIVYRTDSGKFLTLGLKRSGQWPPLWKGAHGDIWFWIAKDQLDCSDDGAVIAEFDELPNGGRVQP